MLDQLVKLVEQNAGEAIVKNQAIPNQFNNAAIHEVAGSIFNTLKGQVAQGNMQQVVSMFQGGANMNSLARQPVATLSIKSLVKLLQLFHLLLRRFIIRLFLQNKMNYQKFAELVIEKL